MPISTEQLVNRLMNSVGTTDMEYPPFYNDVRDACITLEKLQQWKNEAIQVLTEWDDVWVAAGSPGKLGQSKAKAMLDFVSSKPL